jgi:hypothetical protein
MVLKYKVPKIKYYKIPKGFLLFRTSFNEGILKPTKCEDTGKFGTYFSNIPCIALGMALEYKSNMTFSIYKLKKDIKVIEGKYSYRYLFPERYFDCNGKMRKNIDSLEDENVNHFNSKVYPIASAKFFPQNFIKDEKWYDGELFINDKDLKFVKNIKNYTLSWKKLEKEWLKKQTFFRYEFFEKSLTYFK